MPRPLGAPDVNCHDNCTCNEIVAIRNRVQQATPVFNPYFDAPFRRVSIAMAENIGVAQPLDPADWITQYAGRKYKMYERAAKWHTLGIQRGDRICKAFIKSEKLADTSKDPRLIQCRSLKFNLAIGCYLKAIEHKAYNLQGSGALKDWLPTGRLIAKGMNSFQRAYALRRKMSQFSRPVVYSLDCSRFDAHCNKSLLNHEHQVYKRCFKDDPLLQRLCDWQINNICVTAGGTWYNSQGGRMSGDMNTALGNCIIMLQCLAVAMRTLGFNTKQFQILDDGDDCLLITDEKYEHNLAPLPQIFEQFGHKLKLENRATNIHHVIFCQSQVVETFLGLKFVINPARVISKVATGVQHLHDDRFLAKYLGLLGDCELACNPGVPVLQELALALIRKSNGKRPKETFDPTISWRARKELRKHPLKEYPITDAARLSFWEAFDVCPDEQRAAENIFRNW